MAKSVSEVAVEFESTPREVRKFLRSDASGIEAVGKGSRYALPGSKREIDALRKRFIAWQESKVTPESADTDA